VPGTIQAGFVKATGAPGRPLPVRAVVVRHAPDPLIAAGLRRLPGLTAPGLVPVRDVVVEDDTWYFVGEPAPGTKAASTFSGAPGEARAAARIAGHVLRAVRDLHTGTNLPHGDVTPENVTIRRGRMSMLQGAGPHLLVTDVPAGDLPALRRDDVRAVGRLLYFMLEGQVYTQTRWEHAGKSARSLIHDLLSAPDARPKTVDPLLKRLEAFAQGSATAPARAAATPAKAPAEAPAKTPAKAPAKQAAARPSAPPGPAKGGPGENASDNGESSRRKEGDTGDDTWLGGLLVLAALAVVALLLWGLWILGGKALGAAGDFLHRLLTPSGSSRTTPPRETFVAVDPGTGRPPAGGFTTVVGGAKVRLTVGDIRCGEDYFLTSSPAPPPWTPDPRRTDRYCHTRVTLRYDGPADAGALTYPLPGLVEGGRTVTPGWVGAAVKTFDRAAGTIELPPGREIDLPLVYRMGNSAVTDLRAEGLADDVPLLLVGATPSAVGTPRLTPPPAATTTASATRTPSATRAGTRAPGR
jgi:hypothetical protein